VTAGNDLGAIVRACGPSYLQSRRTTVAQRKALRAIGACRTPALGGQRQQCDRCGFEHIQWHSCRSRSCPRCQGAARIEWVEARRQELLPVPYFHVVFTVPEEFNGLARCAPRVFYDLLFRAAARTLADVAESRLHVQLGVLCVLHTWSQTLVLHPHIHCVVPGGGLSFDKKRWITIRKRTFFLPVRVLSRRFRTLLCSMLRQADLPPSVDRGALRVLLAAVERREWVVYAKPPFGGPTQVLAYLANYTHSIAISNRRIVHFDGELVTFRYRDSRSDNTHRLMTLDANEFVRRFLLHVVPKGFVRIRYYGFLANRRRAASIALARELIGNPISLPEPRIVVASQRCPHCHLGTLCVIARLDPQPLLPAYTDTS
jgi:hypothetical protein